MDIRVEPSGRTAESTVREVIRDMQRATRRSGREVATAGRRIILESVRGDRGSLRFQGRRLNVKSKIHAGPTHATVTLRGAPAGAFTILESGAKPHAIVPRRRKALHWGDRFAEHVAHPGVHGRRIWTAAGKALTDKLDDSIEKLFDQAVN